MPPLFDLTSQPTGCDASSCHPTSPLAAYPPTSGLHTSHLKRLGEGGDACQNCHWNYNYNTQHRDAIIQGYDAQTNTFTPGNIINFAFIQSASDTSPISGNFDPNNKDCSSVSCHNGSGARNWYDASGSGCIACHIVGSGNTFPNPPDPSSNAHQRHVSGKGYACTECHNGYDSSGTHNNGTLNSGAALIALANGGNFTENAPADPTDDTCNSVKCHGVSNTTPAWGTPGPLPCTTCHNDPDIDPLVTNATGANGKHNYHVTTLGLSCTLCHNGYTAQTTHVDETYGDNPAGTLDIVHFSSPTMTWTNSINTCGSIGCHEDRDWYTTVATGCTGCHKSGNTFPPDAPDPSTNAHTKHLSQGYACDKCHNGYSSDPNHNTGTLNSGATLITLADGGTVTENVPTDATDDTCNGVICHGTANTTPPWGTPGIACTDCHIVGSGNTAPQPPDPLLTNAHPKHVTDKGYSCTTCHNGYDASGQHANGTLNSGATLVSLSGGGTLTENVPADAADDTCSGVSCHGVSNTTPSWGTTGPLACTVCHGDSAINPLVTNATGAAGKHDRHVTQNGSPCTLCHNGYTAQSTHVDGTYGDAGGTVDIVIWDSAAQSSATWTNSSNTCGSFTCHGDVDWYTTAAFGCTSCHQAGNTFPPDPPDPSTNAHPKHVTNQGYACTECHNGYSSDPNHNTGTLNSGATLISLSGGGTITENVPTDATDDTCNGVSCHGTANTTPPWGTPGIACTDCHIVGSGNTFPQPPDPSSYAHGKHVTNNGIACTECHSGYDTKSTHADKAATSGATIITLAGGGTFNENTPADPTDDTCNNVSCHGVSNTTPNWGSTGITCDDCHLDSAINPRVTNGSGAAGKHIPHVTNQGYACTMCHYNYDTQSTHADDTYGTAEPGEFVIFDPAHSSVTWTGGTTTCSSVGCHADADWYTTSTGCSFCHSAAVDNGDGGPTRRAVIGDFSNTSHHVAGTVTDADCEVCHMEAADKATYHMDNQITLRDPDTGNALSPITSLTRNRANAILEAEVLNVQNNFCFKCHDSGGAAGSHVTALGFTAARPFSSTVRTQVPDVFTAFGTGNTSFHPVRGAAANQHATGSMVAPWNTGSHETITCFDCHEANGHGGVNQRMIREDNTNIDFDTLLTLSDIANVSATYQTSIGDPIIELCQRCHDSAVYGGDGNGTGFNRHDIEHAVTPYGCMGCHAGIVNDTIGMSYELDNGAAPGAIHGNSFTWPASACCGAANQPSYSFAMGGYLTGALGDTGGGGSSGSCAGGQCSHGTSGRTYNPQ